MSLKESKGSSSSSNLKFLKLNSQELKSRPDLVAVDGVLYDVNNIAESHPGGSIVLASGGTFFVLDVETVFLYQKHDFAHKALYCVFYSLMLRRTEFGIERKTQRENFDLETLKNVNTYLSFSF